MLEDKKRNSFREFAFIAIYLIITWYFSKFILQAFGEKPHTVQTLAVFVFCSLFCASGKLFKYLIFQ